MQPHIGIKPEHLKECAAMLNKLLADEAVLYVKTLNYHWNVTGPHFDALHLFFQRQYEQMLTITDDVAERVRALGFPAFGTMKEFLGNTQLQEQLHVTSEQDMIKNLLNDHEVIIRSLRTGQQMAMDKYHDAGTNNFLCDLMEKQEKMAWMLRSFLQGGKE
ncbi:MAG TPA: DNA starvation/stationary phase protection protein [Candidatus Limnocylindria bacterium]|nr:DNA starvation/stationary phase protection protein [Candidatus Limnocylindria bacterium]